MSFTNDQVAALNANLDAGKVKSREQAGRSLSYIEGWFALAEANRIFGHDGWDRRTELTDLGAAEQIGDKWRVRFMATVTITVRAGETVVTRQGVGYGSGIAKDLGDAYESAIKEAETDATKRALMTFGWPFGLALYDKTQEHVEGNGAAKKPTYSATTDGNTYAARKPANGTGKTGLAPAVKARIKAMLDDLDHATAEEVHAWTETYGPEINELPPATAEWVWGKRDARLSALDVTRAG